MRISDWSSDVCSSDLTARLPVGVVRIAKAIDNGIEDIARLGDLLRFEQFAPFPGADKVPRMMPERMNAVAVAVAVRHALAGALDPYRALDVLPERMGGQQRMATDRNRDV